MDLSLRDGKYYELVYAALLHDIGKIPQRAGERTVEEGSEYKTHDDLGARLVNEYRELFEKLGLDIDTIRLLIRYHHHSLRGFKPPETIRDLLYLLEDADRKSAMERNMGDEIPATGRSQIEYLVSPLWVVDYYKRRKEGQGKLINDELPPGSSICYKPVSITAEFKDKDPLKEEDLEEIEGVLKAGSCFEKDGIEKYYERILRDLMEILSSLRDLVVNGAMGVDELLETLTSYIRYSFLFIPDAVYGVDIPSTSLSTHLILTAALASSYMLSGSKRDRECDIRAGLLDLSGIQKYIASYARRRGALRQLRGRSLLLQLVMKAASYKLLKELGLNMVHLVLDRGDSALFILPSTIDEKTFNDAAGKVEEAIYRLFHGDIYIAYALSNSFTPSYEAPWSDDFGSKGFSKTMLELGKKAGESKRRKYKLLDPKTLSVNTIIDEKDVRIADECPLCKATMFKDELIPLDRIDEKTRRELNIDEDVDKICPSCLLAHIAGYAAENLVYIIEIRSKDTTDKLYERLREGYISEFVGYVPNTPVKYGIIPLKGLDTTYIIASIKSDDRRIHYSFMKAIIQWIDKKILGGGEKVSVVIYKNNDPGGFIPRGRDLEDLIGDLGKLERTRIGFSVIFTNISLRRGELDELAEIPGGSERQTLLSWIKIDGDRMGLTGLHLIGSLGRYLTFNELVNLYTNLVGQLILYKKARLISGGENMLRDRIVVVYSGGDDSFIVSRFVEGLYYLYYYREWFAGFFGRIGSRELLTISAGLILREPDYPAYLAYRETVDALERAKDEGRNRVFADVLKIGARGKGSVDWGMYRLVVEKSTSQELLGIVSSNKQLSHRLLWVARNIVEQYYRFKDSGDPEYLRRSIEYLVNYIYLYNRLEKTREFIDKLIQENILGETIKPQEIINTYSQNTDAITEEMDKLARLLPLLLLRIREGI